jgi:hypothetical protein
MPRVCRLIGAMLAVPRRGKLRKKSNNIGHITPPRLNAFDFPADETTARALKFEISDWKAHRGTGEQDAGSESGRCNHAFCSSIEIPYDTNQWLRDTGSFLISAGEVEVVLWNSGDVVCERKRKLDELSMKHKKRASAKKASAGCNSMTLEIMPPQLCVGGRYSFESILSVYGMPKPWDTGYVEIQPDRQPNHTDTQELRAFLNKFRFSIGIWWQTDNPITVYITLEAEHLDGCAQCTYSVPQNKELELAILEKVCTAL